MLGVVRDGRLYLHPISQMHQLRPTLTYMDVFHRKSSRKSRGGADTESDDDDGPPPDPDDPTPLLPVAKEQKLVGEVKELQVSLRKAEDKNTLSLQGGLSSARREMLHLLREEEDEAWMDVEFCDGETEEAEAAFQSIFSKRNDELSCQADLASIVKSIPNLH